MKILLIGATGQIGFALVQAIAKTENSLTVMVRTNCILKFPVNVKIHKFEIFDSKAFKSILKNYDRVIYGIGLPEQFLFDKMKFETVNYELFNTFLEQFIKSEIPNLIYISTYEVFKEDENGIIRESEKMVDEKDLTPYFKAMVKAYKSVLNYQNKYKFNLTTIHPAAVYGGLNTANGFTNYIENCLHKRFWKVPFIFKGMFPIVHVDSVANAIIRSFSKPGQYIISDQMTNLKEIATIIRCYSNSYIPLIFPLWIVKIGTFLLELIALVIRKKPILSKTQVKFIIKDLEPKSENAINILDWKPTSISNGIERYFNDSRKYQSQ